MRRRCEDEVYPVKRMRFKECLWYWTYGIYDGKILAWQPLPKEYKSEEEQVDLSKDEFEEWLYDGDNRIGAAQMVIDNLKSKHGL